LPSLDNGLLTARGLFHRRKRRPLDGVRREAGDARDLVVPFYVRVCPFLEAWGLVLIALWLLSHKLFAGNPTVHEERMLLAGLGGSLGASERA
jgi:hypothetical protein